MALIHWWPLNGTLDDYGLNPITLSTVGATVNNNGKIGKCYNCDSGHYLQTTDTLFSNNMTFSISYWLYVNEYPSSAWMDIWHIGNFRAEIYDSSKMWTGCGDSVVSVMGNTIPLTTWIHYTHVIDLENAMYYVYENGVVIKSKAFTTLDATMTSSDIVFGQSTLNLKFNDIRIYDHALSAKEVKEISKACILHYDFEDEEIEPTTNLITKFDPSFASYADGTSLNSLTFSNQANATVFNITTFEGEKCANFVPVSSNLRCYFYQSSYASKTYTVSVEYKSDSASNTALHFERYGGDYNWTGSNAIYSSSDVNTWKKLTITFTNTSDTTLYCFIMGPANANIYFKRFQIEEKDHSTPFVKGTRTGVVYDSSGYGNNGSFNNSLATIISTNSPLGLNYLSIPAATTITHPRCLTATATEQEWTVSAWVYPLSDESAYLNNFNSGNYLYAFSQGNKPILYLNSGTDDYYNYGNTVLPMNQWTLVTFVFKNSNGTKLIYYNAEQKTNTSGPNKTSTPRGIPETVTLFSGFNGYIADYKEYATALSATDVLKEYQSMASVDNKYNIISKGGIVEFGENIAEFAEYKIESDSTNSVFDGHLTCKTQSSYSPNPAYPGIGRATQNNLSVNASEKGIRIYSKPNWDGRAQSGSGWDTWGGLCYSPMKYSNCLIKGHTYLLTFHISGQSSRDMDTLIFSSQIGWGNWCQPSPSNNQRKTHGANFQGECDCYYTFTINDDIWKVCSDANVSGANGYNSAFTPGETYLSYAGIKIGYTYGQTGELGTDVYVTNLQFYDITGLDLTAEEIMQNGTIRLLQAVEEPSTTKFRTSDFSVLTAKSFNS